MTRSTTAWEVTIGSPHPKQLLEHTIDIEKTLEDWIEKVPELLEPGFEVLARQLITDVGPVDLLGLDRTGRIVVVEIKREDVYRSAFAQVLDYTAYIAALSYDELAQAVDVNRKKRGQASSFEDLLRGVIGAKELDNWTPDAAGRPRMMLVGTDADASLRRVVDYLTTHYDVPVNGVFFDVSKTASGSTILVRSGVVADEQAAHQGQRRGRGGVSNDELKASAAEAGVAELVESVLSAWETSTGQTGRPERGKFWSLPARRDARRVTGWICPLDSDEPNSKRAWLRLFMQNLSSDLSVSADDLRASLSTSGIELDDEGWFAVSNLETASVVARWIKDAYGAAAAVALGPPSISSALIAEED